jgi:NTP pyrophosphatase (non-canonical NTP hydrolase)
MRLYRENRNRPNNPLYYVCKLAEEVGEVSEAAVALEGSRRKLKKFQAEGRTPLSAFTEELADVINVAMLAAEQRDISPEALLIRAAEKMKEKRIGSGGGTSGK